MLETSPAVKRKERGPLSLLLDPYILAMGNAKERRMNERMQ